MCFLARIYFCFCFFSNLSANLCQNLFRQQQKFQNTKMNNVRTRYAHKTVINEKYLPNFCHSDSLPGEILGINQELCKIFLLKRPYWSANITQLFSIILRNFRQMLTNWTKLLCPACASTCLYGSIFLSIWYEKPLSIQLTMKYCQNLACAVCISCLVRSAAVAFCVFIFTQILNLFYIDFCFC